MGGTYGGNAVACAAAVATLDVMQEEDLPGNAERQGGRLLDFFRAKQERYPGLGDVRGKGLMCAIECVLPGTKEPDAAAAAAFIAEAAKRKVILMGAGPHGSCVRFIPALNVSESEMDLALSVFDECLGQVYA